MNSTPPADPPVNVNNEENSTTSDHVVQPPAGLSAEDVQRIATAVAALVGRPSSSNNPLVSGPSQVPAPPTAGTEFVYRVVYSWCNCNPASLSGSSRITELMGAYSTFLNSAPLVLFFLNLLSQHGGKIFCHFEITRLTALLGWYNSSETAEKKFATLLAVSLPHLGFIYTSYTACQRWFVRSFLRQLLYYI